MDYAKGIRQCLFCHQFRMLSSSIKLPVCDFDYFLRPARRRIHLLCIL